MEGMGAGLAQVTFHNKLGSQADRIARIAALAREVAPFVGAGPDLATEAARVVKSDLRSEMVGEFPELQGIMGGYYARAEGLPDAVANACRAHYQPLGPSDEVPSEPVSMAVALADKLDTLAGFWAIDERPTGSKDPFALRRAALGVIRIALENGLRFALTDLAAHAIDHARPGAPPPLPQHSDLVVAEQVAALHEQYVAEAADGAGGAGGASDEVAASLLGFFHDRLKVHLRDAGIRHDVIDACLAMPGNDDLTLLVKRAEALAAFLATDDGENLVQGFKRANNILIQAEEKDGVEYSFGADPKFAEDATETALFAALDAAEAAIAPAMQAEDFPAAMAAMAAMRAPIDAFFEAVQVNSPNEIVRRNRLNLLSRIRATCLQVADLTRLEG
jgi:glycyl-tRNA synthetase beta chain